MLASAKRVLPFHSLVMLTRVCSALLNDSTRSAERFRFFARHAFRPVLRIVMLRNRTAGSHG